MFGASIHILFKAFLGHLKSVPATILFLNVEAWVIYNVNMAVLGHLRSFEWLVEFLIGIPRCVHVKLSQMQVMQKSGSFFPESS